MTGMSGTGPAATIRRVRAGDWGRLRDVRLRALRSDPRSFGSTHAEVAARDDGFWRTWATEHSRGQDHCTLLALLGRRAVALVRIEHDPERPAVFGIHSMWVAPEVRRRGLALRLLAEAERWIETAGGTEAELNVVDRAVPAMRLYGRAGYRLDGRSEPATHAGAFDLGMRKPLDAPKGV
jgi:GNAT superfamily N-acetyltransferase